MTPSMLVIAQSVTYHSAPCQDLYNLHRSYRHMPDTVNNKTQDEMKLGWFHVRLKQAFGSSIENYSYLLSGSFVLLHGSHYLETPTRP